MANGSSGPSPKNGPSNNNQVINRQSYLSKTNKAAKSPQPLKLSGNMANEIDLTRASPSQISQMVHQRELRNNSTMAITNNAN